MTRQDCDHAPSADPRKAGGCVKCGAKLPAKESMTPPAPKSTAKKVAPAAEYETTASFHEREVPNGEPLRVSTRWPIRLQIISAHASGGTHVLFKYVVIREAS